MAMRIYFPMCIDAYVGYIRQMSDNAEVDADIRIRMAIPNDNGLVEDNDRQLTLAWCSNEQIPQQDQTGGEDFWGCHGPRLDPR